MLKFKVLAESILKNLNEGKIKDEAFEQFEKGMKWAIEHPDGTTTYQMEKPESLRDATNHINLEELFGDSVLEEDIDLKKVEELKKKGLLVQIKTKEGQTKFVKPENIPDDVEEVE